MLLISSCSVTDGYAFEGLIRRIVSGPVVVVEGPVPHSAEPLWPQEADTVKHAVPSRVREYATGRAFARRALGMLGVPPLPLPSKSDRSPLWPAGIVGSVTHVSNYCAVAVACTTDISAIGIDVENVDRFDTIYATQIFSPTESRLYISDSSREELKRLGTLIFSAKEAIYKCLSALAKVQLSFRDCTIELEQKTGTFAMNVPASAQIFARERRIVGQFGFSGALVGTAITLSPGAAADRE